MKAPGAHPKERERLAELLALEILDTPPDGELDRITRIAAQVFHAPTALVSLIDDKRQWFKSRYCFDATDGPRETSFCGHAILEDQIFVVENAESDPRFFDNPEVIREGGVKFYVGVPIRTPSGLPMGTLCVIDHSPHTPNAHELSILSELGLLVESWLSRYELANAQVRSRIEVNARLTAVLGSMAEAVIFMNAQGHVISTNPVADALPECILLVLTNRERNTFNVTVLDEARVPIDARELPHWKALSTSQSQPRKVFGFREGRGDVHWYEITCEAIGSGTQAVGVACSLLDVTDHQRVLIALQASEQRLQAMAANVPGTIYQIYAKSDGSVEFPYISPGVERLYGVTPEEWMANPNRSLEWIVEEDRESYLQTYEHARAQLSRFDWEGRTRTARPGEVLWIHCQSQPSVEPDGRIVWNGVVSDITFSKLQEEALRKSEERFRIVAEQTHQMIYDIDVTSGTTVWAGATWALLGRTHAEMQSLGLVGWLESIHPDDRTFVSAEVERNTAIHDVFSVRYRLRRADGTYIWTHDRGAYIRGRRGKPIRMLGTVSDVEAEVNALRQSDESHKRAEALIAAIPDTVIRVTKEGRVLDVRHLPTWLRGERNTASDPPSLFELTPSQLAEPCLARVSEVVVRGIPERFELTLDDEEDGRDVEVRLSPSGVNEAVLVLRDISEQRAVERLKDQFVSTVSHELRTPLASIRGALGLMTAGIAGDLSPMMRELSELALENTKRLERLISDLLDLESSDSGQLRLSLACNDLRQLLEKTMRSVTPFASSLGIGLRFETELRTAPAIVDADRFEQIVSNLLSNAIKHSGVNADVILRLYPATDCYRIEVENSGTSIPESFRSRIFQRFAMADASDSRKRGGTGLGLAIAKALVERMNGRIDYTSEFGTTRFFIELPNMPDETTEPQNTNSGLISEGVPVVG